MNARLLFWCLIPGLAFAAPKLVVVPFAGPKAAAIRDQITGPLCGEVTCAPAAKVAKGNKVDWAKAKKEKVTFALMGKVVKQKGKPAIELSLVNAAKKVKWKQSYKLAKNGKLSSSDAQDAVSAVSSAVGGGSDSSAPPPTRTTEEPPTRTTTATPPAGSDTGSSDDTEAPVLPTRAERMAATSTETTPEEPEPAPSKPKGPHANPLVIGQVGLDFSRRTFEYSDVLSANLRSYKAGFIASPRLHAELYPLSRSMDGVPAGLGIELDYAFSVGLKSSPPNGPKYPTSVSHLDAALRLRLHPTDGNLVVTPFVGFRSQRFSTSAADDGTTLVGLANVGIGALRIGGQVEGTVSDPVLLFGELSLLPVLSTGALKDYFPKTSGFGFEVNGGVGVKVMEELQIRAALNVTRYGLSFTTNPADTYLASGASDLYLGLSLGLRYTY